MTCSCPKCNAHIDIDETTASDAGTASSCPECKARFWIQRESFARRAVRKEGAIYCASCGNTLNHLIVCSSCGIRFPEYLLVQNSKPVRRKAKKQAISFSFSLGPSKKSSGAPLTAVGKTKSSPKKLLTVLGVALAVTALAAGGGLLYMKNKAQKQYAENFVLALYLMKTGTDVGIKQSAAVSSDWKAKSDAGQPYSRSASPEYDIRSSKIKGELESILNKMQKPPKVYETVNEKLNRLNAVYQKARVLPSAPADSLPVFAENVAKVEKEYQAAAKDLKGAITGELAEAVTKGKQKYKGLSDF